MEAEEEKLSRRVQAAGCGVGRGEFSEERKSTTGLALVLSGGCRIEVQRDVDVLTFERFRGENRTGWNMHPPNFGPPIGLGCPRRQENIREGKLNGITIWMRRRASRCRLLKSEVFKSRPSSRTPCVS